jgi:hypothetical protein
MVNNRRNTRQHAQTHAPLVSNTSSQHIGLTFPPQTCPTIAQFRMCVCVCVLYTEFALSFSRYVHCASTCMFPKQKPVPPPNNTQVFFLSTVTPPEARICAKNNNKNHSNGGSSSSSDDDNDDNDNNNQSSKQQKDVFADLAVGGLQVFAWPFRHSNKTKQLSELDPNTSNHDKMECRQI